MRYIEILRENDDLKAEWARLEKTLIDAHDAYAANPNRQNIEAVWAAQKAQQDYHEKYWPSPKHEEPSASDTYKGEHEAPDHESGRPLYDLTGVFPEDFYKGQVDQYCQGDRTAANIALGLKNKPNFTVKIYRSVPKTAPRKINPGDWVAITRSYAVEHGRDNLRNDYYIVTKTVYARDLFNDGNLQEWGYDPQPRVPRSPRKTDAS